MCLSKSTPTPKQPDPPPPPPPPPKLISPEDDKANPSVDAANVRSANKARKSLRIDLNSDTGTGGESSGLAIPAQ